MFRAMVLKGLLGEKEKLENAMKKAKCRVSIAELGDGCLID